MIFAEAGIVFNSIRFRASQHFGHRNSRREGSFHLRREFVNEVLEIVVLSVVNTMDYVRSCVYY